jgi:NTE family protein
LEHKVGIVLSGGGARGIAHLGLLQVMEECGLKPSVISGTSAGSMVGAFYGAGYPIKQIIDIIEHHRFFNISDMLFRKLGVFAMKAFQDLFFRYFPNNSFDDLDITLYAAATDISKGQSVYFSEGNLAQAVMASSCIPIIFQPLQINDSYYVDGGVLNNFPIEPLIGNCDLIIGSNVNSIKPETAQIHMKDILDRSYHLAMSYSISIKKQQCDFFFEPPNMSQYSIFDTKKAREIFDYSYHHALNHKHQLMAMKEKS